MSKEAITITVPPEQADILLQALERISCRDIRDCIADEYRKRVYDAFVRLCPDRAYTSTPLDFDTLLAYLEARIARMEEAARHHRRSTDHEVKP